MPDASFMGVHEYVRKRARYHAGSLCRAPGFSWSDREDVVQDLVVDTWQRWPHFDSARASALTFASRVLHNKTSSLLRHRHAEKRYCIANCVLPALAQDPADQRCSAQKLELTIDVNEVIRRLPAELREIAIGLMTDTVTNLATAMGVSRGTIHRRIQEIRPYFESAGLCAITSQERANDRD